MTHDYSQHPGEAQRCNDPLCECHYRHVLHADEMAERQYLERFGTRFEYLPEQQSQDELPIEYPSDEEIAYMAERYEQASYDNWQLNMRAALITQPVMPDELEEEMQPYPGCKPSCTDPRCPAWDSAHAERVFHPNQCSACWREAAYSCISCGRRICQFHMATPVLCGKMCCYGCNSTDIREIELHLYRCFFFDERMNIVHQEDRLVSRAPYRYCQIVCHQRGYYTFAVGDLS